MINNAVRSLPGSFETSSDLLGAIMRNALYGRPDDYYTKLADRYRALTPAALDAAARKVIDPSRLIWVVVGDAAKVRPLIERAVRAHNEIPLEIRRRAFSPKYLS